MKVGIFSPYLATLGGGERYVFTVAEFFLRRNDIVDIFSDTKIDIWEVKNRFDLDLGGVTFKENIFSSVGLMGKLLITREYDLIFYLSDGSIPSLFAKNNILHFQTPFRQAQGSLFTKLKLIKINHIICNSRFTKQFIDQTFGVESLVVYPPVDIEKFTPGKKEKIILSVGRFFSPSHPKKQLEMVEIFKNLISLGLREWKLVLIGGITGDSKADVDQLLKNVNGLPVKIITDGNFATLKDYYSRASIYWHAAGFGEDLEQFPQRAEHFGISTVEAMAAGAVPLVYNGGGQKEVVDDGANGFLWTTTDDLISKTNQLVNNPKMLKNLSLKAVEKSKSYSKDQFFHNLSLLI